MVVLAKDAVKSIKPGDLAEIKSYKNPDPAILHVMQVGELREMWGGCQLGNRRRASKVIFSSLNSYPKGLKRGPHE